MLALLVYLGIIKNSTGSFNLLESEEYGANNISLALQDALLCYEMPLFAWMHYYAFPWTDYDDRRLSSRLTISCAIRDSLGFKDILHDAYTTFIKKPSFYPQEQHVEEDLWADDDEGMDEFRPLVRPSLAFSNEPTISLHFDDPTADEDAEYNAAKRLVYGDYNFPVIHEDPNFSYPPNIQQHIDEESAGFALHFKGGTIPKRKEFDSNEEISARLLQWQNASRSD
jgi:hypothetical protein